MFWDNALVDDIVLNGDRKRICSMLKEVFEDSSTRKAIDIVLLHKDTKFLWLDYTVHSAHQPNCIACVVFRIFHKPPFGTFVSHICLYKTPYIHQINSALDHKQAALHRHRIRTKLLNLTQYIAWIYVCNIALHLCAKKTSVDFCQKLTFKKYCCNINDLSTFQRIGKPTTSTLYLHTT